MFHHHNFFTTNDFELNPNSIKERTTSYIITNARKGNGLVVYIPGFGGDLGDYTQTFCKKVSESHPEYSAMSIEYFCIHSRPNVGAEVTFEVSDKINVNPQYSNLSTDDFYQEIIRLSQSKPLRVSGSLTPPNGEYQNFGIMAAVDIINAILDAVERYQIDMNNIILVGSSYGGYVANLITKISSGLIRAVFDNSSWANPNLAYVTGRELNRPEFSQRINSNLALSLFVKSPWTLKSNMPNSFEAGKYAIRCFNPVDLEVMRNSGGQKTIYYLAHAYNDTIAPMNEKLDMVQNMLAIGMHVNMVIYDESDIDGRFIKSMSHGMGLSMLEFFDRGLKYIESQDINFIATLNEKLDYQYDNEKYTFEHIDNKIQCSYQA